MQGPDNNSLSIQFSADISLQALNALYKASGDSGRCSPTDQRCGLILNSSGTNELVCGARLLQYDSVWLLRNLCSHPDHRRQGYASALLKHLTSDQALSPLFTIPLPHLNDWYLSNGFQLISEGWLPEALERVLKQSRRRHKDVQMMKAIKANDC
ncbi:GNAT family N-acetyltransferase [Thalassolituus marinus]|nr:GNAT family N-acetyltransferase [Thalassolituus marinus]